MKKNIIIISAAILFAGCSTIDFTDPTGARYRSQSQLWKKGIKSATVDITRTTPEGVIESKRLVIEGYTSGSEAADITGAAVRAAVEGAK